jgi:hypothetical protein
MANEGIGPKEKQTLELLVKLSRLEEFRSWVKDLVEPTIAQLEAELAKPLQYSEIDLKAKLLHLNSLKYLFKDVFTQSRQVLEDEE